MSEAMDRVRDIEQLPIFPLPLVMVPGELLPLHIFEDRYRRMLSDIGPAGGLFGIILFEANDNFADRPDKETVGCVAEIREAHELPDGRSNIVTLGIVRFRLHDWVDSDKPYLVGDVSFFEDGEVEDTSIAGLSDEVFGLFERIAKAAFRMGGNRGQFPEISRTDAQSFSFLAAAALNFDSELKYRFLEMTSTVERLQKLREIMLRTVIQMEVSADIQIAAKTNGHSKKKIDL